MTPATRAVLAAALLALLGPPAAAAESPVDARTALRAALTAPDPPSPVGSILPVGAESPWSLVSDPLPPATTASFLPLELFAPLSADLGPGLDARRQAVESGRGVWWAEAAARFQLAAATCSDPWSYEAALALGGEAAYLAGALDEADDYFQRAASAGRGSSRVPWYRLGRGLALGGMGRHEQAIEALTAAAAALPEEGRRVALVGLIGSAVSTERSGAALALTALLHEAAGDGSASILDPYLEAELAYRAGDLDRAVVLLTALEQEPGPRQPWVRVRLADCALMRDDADAFESWRKVLEAAGDRESLALARLRSIQRDLTLGVDVDVPEAMAQLRELGGIDESIQLEAVLAEAAYLYHAEMTLEGCRTDRQTLLRNGAFPGRQAVEGRMCEGAAALVRDHPDDPVRVSAMYLDFVEQRLAPACNDPDLLLHAAGAMEDLGLWEEARRARATVLARGDIPAQSAAEVTLDLAALYRAAGETEEGLETIAYHRSENGGAGWRVDLIEAELLLDHGDLAAATTAARAALGERPPDSAAGRAHRVLGRVALREGRWADAATALHRARSLVQAAPTEAAVDGIGEAWALLQGGRAEQALETLDGLPEDAAPADSVTALLYIRARSLEQIGREEEALALLADLPDASGPALWSELAALERETLAWNARREAREYDVPGSSARPPSEH